MMKRNNKHILRPVLIAALAVVLAASAGIGTAWAYFTTYATAKGGYTLHLGDTTELDEVVNGNKKSVKITATSGEPVYVRVKAFNSDDYKIEDDADGTNWVLAEDGYYYYTKPLVPATADDGKTWTSQATDPALTLEIGLSDTIETGTTSPIETANVNIVVIYETTRALYNAEGTAFEAWDSEAMKAGWTDKVTVRKSTVEGGN